MKKVFFALIIISILLFLSRLFLTDILFIQKNNFLTNSSELNLLVLGKPGPGYIGSENTDSIMIIHYDINKNKAFLIPIPRDLIVKNENGDLKKINALYGDGEIKFLLEKASKFSGFKLENYIVVDLILITRLVDFLGGLEIDLKKPVIDAITLFTLPTGKQKLNGYLTEFVLRSRYNQEGDFFRIKNQIEVLKALKNKLANLNTKEKINLVRFLEKNKNHWQANLETSDLLALIAKIKTPSGLKIIPIIVDFDSGFLESSYFKINNNNVYGIYPKAGIDNFFYIKNFIQSEIKKLKQ